MKTRKNSMIKTYIGAVAYVGLIDEGGANVVIVAGVVVHVTTMTELSN